MDQERKALFRDNVETAMRSMRRSKSEIAAQLGFSESEKKWLSKICRHGLDRQNARTIEKLGQLSKLLFGSDDIRQFWYPKPPQNAVEALDRMKALAETTKSAVGLTTYVVCCTTNFSTQDLHNLKSELDKLRNIIKELEEKQNIQ